MSEISYRQLSIDGHEIFYREAGRHDAPTVLLLHGFPSAGHMFRDLIPLLAARFHLVAPDLPGFGQSAMPAPEAFDYSFANVARIIGRFADAVGLDRFAIFVFDYGAPAGFRMALNHPGRVSAIISQNGNAYEDGLSVGWDAMKAFWKHPTDEYRESLRAAFTPAATRYQYTQGVPNPSIVSPDGSTLDDYYLARPGAHAVQLKYFEDYGSNVALYPEFQRYFRQHRPAMLAVWGKNDPYFLPAGAEAFKRDLPDAEVHLLDTGHFALETHSAEIAQLITAFLPRVMG
jgi:pimeloyl-ACP methyl ester carboxylesterase